VTTTTEESIHASNKPLAMPVQVHLGIERKGPSEEVDPSNNIADGVNRRRTRHPLSLSLFSLKCHPSRLHKSNQLIPITKQQSTTIKQNGSTSRSRTKAISSLTTATTTATTAHFKLLFSSLRLLLLLEGKKSETEKFFGFLTSNTKNLGQ